MSVFNGAALYTKAEIGKALDNRKALNTKYIRIEQVAMENTMLVDKSYKRLGFLWTVRKSDYENMMSDCDFMFGSYLYLHKWLLAKGYINQAESDGIHNHSHCFSSKVKAIKNLYNGGKDCYLNPEQAQFVNYYKDVKTE